MADKKPAARKPKPQSSPVFDQKQIDDAEKRYQKQQMRYKIKDSAGDLESQITYISDMLQLLSVMSLSILSVADKLKPFMPKDLADEMGKWKVVIRKFEQLKLRKPLEMTYDKKGKAVVLETMVEKAGKITRILKDAE